MQLTLDGTRGSVGRAGPETSEFGGDTSCVHVTDGQGAMLILDAGSGLARLNPICDAATDRIEILLTHLHMDHIQGLGFFQPLFDPSVSVRLWGPVSSVTGLSDRLGRYLSPPLFPVRLRDLSNVELCDVRPGRFQIGPFSITADLVTHPGPTLGYRIESGESSLAYLPDHEPALGAAEFPPEPEWTSGYDLCRRVDTLVHDFQYTSEEYATRQGWGHSSMSHAVAFARHVGARRLVSFHHDPDHDDAMLEEAHSAAAAELAGPTLVPGRAGLVLDV